MPTLPRHLLLAAVVLTVCCAERQAVAGALELQKAVAQMAGERSGQSRAVQQVQLRRQLRHRYIRPAAVAWHERVQAVFARPATPAQPEGPLVHVIYPPSRFRLPPPALLA